MKKFLILILLFSFNSQAQTGSFKNLNAMRDMSTDAQELYTQAQLLVSVVSSEKDDKEEGTCYALGTLGSSRARLMKKSAFLSAYSHQLSALLVEISGHTNSLLALCNRKANLSTQMQPAVGPGGKSKMNTNDRMARAQQIQSLAGQISQVIQSGLQ